MSSGDTRTRRKLVVEGKLIAAPNRNSIHLEGEILQLPVTLHLEDDRITGSGRANDRLQLRHCLQRGVIDCADYVPGLQPRIWGS